jgi:hypothetical protein
MNKRPFESSAMNIPDSRTRPNAAIFAARFAIAGLALLSVMASFNPQWGLWGVDSSVVWPTWFRVVLVAAIAVFIVPPAASFAERHLERGVGNLSYSNFRMLYIVFAAAMVGLFIAYTSRNQFQGDGYNVMGHLIGGYVFSPTEPLDYLLHSAVAKAFGGGEVGVLRSYQFCAYLAGLAFLTAIYLFMRERKDIILGAILAAAFGTMLFFFGYVESYTFRFLFMFLYVVSATRDWQARRISVSAIALLALAVGFHLSSLVLTPSFIFLLWNKHRTRQALMIAIAALLGLIALATVNLFLFAPIRLLQIAVPLNATPLNPYHLFSKEHLFDLLNALLLSSPLIVVLTIFLVNAPKRRVLWAALVAGPALVFALIIDPKIGAFRDWDLLSIAAAPIMALLIFEIAGISRGAYGLIIPVLLFAIMHTGGWVLWNTDADASYAKIRNIVRRDPHFSRNYYRGYNNKAWSIIVGRFRDDPAEVVRADFERYRGEPNDTLNVCNLAYAYLAAGDSANAARIARENWRRFAGDAGAVSALGSLLHSLGYPSDTEAMYETYIAGGGNDYRLYRDLGMIKEMTGKIDSAMILYDRSLTLMPEPSIKAELAFYARASSMGYNDIALSGFRRVVHRAPEKLRATIASLTDALAAGDRARIVPLAQSLAAANR